MVGDRSPNEDDDLWRVIFSRWGWWDARSRGDPARVRARDRSRD
jgi:hypothetical protein